MVSQHLEQAIVEEDKDREEAEVEKKLLDDEDQPVVVELIENED